MLTGQSELETIRDPPSLDVGKFAGIIDASAEGLLEKIKGLSSNNVIYTM